MKTITMFILSNCPYCREALRWIEDLKNEKPDYRRIEMVVFDEARSADVANNFDYYYVPTLYVGAKKLHEGTATKEKLRKVFDAALNG